MRKNNFDRAEQSKGFRNAMRTFERAHRPLPPIPRRFAASLKTIEKWCFSTRDISAMGMYFFDFYLSEALTGASPDYFAVSHAGHGVNSYALNYQIVDGPLILFAQAPWGGVYNDRGKDELRVAALFERIATLINVIDRAKAMERVGQPGWLCVFESHLRDLFAWGWLPHKLDGKDAARAWISARQLPRRPVEPLSVDKLPTAAAHQFLEEGGPALPLESN